MAGEIVVGVFDRTRLSDGLAAVHRGGFGFQARVLDGARGDLAAQLRRAGLHADLRVEDPAVDSAVILVTAPGRERSLADTLVRAGARAVWLSSRDALTSLLLPAVAAAARPPRPAPEAVPTPGPWPDARRPLHEPTSESVGVESAGD